MKGGELTHLDSSGSARMVGVSEKAETRRCAVAEGKIALQPATVELIRRHGVEKGDVLAVSRTAAITAAKKTPDWIVLAHPLRVTGIETEFKLEEKGITARVTVQAVDRTGVEMEALTGVSAALLNIYDMVKGVDRSAVIGEIRLIEKRGGKSDYTV